MTMWRHDQGDLEVAPSFSLRTQGQDPGVDYGANGFMFDVICGGRPIIITGLQICSADGSPYDYKVTPHPWLRPSSSSISKGDYCCSELVGPRPKQPQIPNQKTSTPNPGLLQLPPQLLGKYCSNIMGRLDDGRL